MIEVFSIDFPFVTTAHDLLFVTQLMYIFCTSIVLPLVFKRGIITLCFLVNFLFNTYPNLKWPPRMPTNVLHLSNVERWM